jgi:hypothetical protein
MTDDLDRLRTYIASLPAATEDGLKEGRATFDDVVAHDVAAGQYGSSRPDTRRWQARGTASSPPRFRMLLVLGVLVLLVVAVAAALALGRPGPSVYPTAGGHRAPRILVGLVSDDVNVTVASGSYDMTFDDTTVPPPGCAQSNGGSGAQRDQGTVQSVCPSDLLPDISGEGTVDTDPYAMVAVSQDGPLGTITLYDNGTDVWEIGGGDYGLAGPGQAGPGAPLSGYSSSVEGTVGEQAGALDMLGLASGTGYLDLEAEEIHGAQPAGTGTVDGVPVTIYKLSVTGLQDPDLNGLSAEQVATIRAADAVLQETGFPGKTTWVSVDADGYIREERTTYSLSDGSSVTQDTVLSDFGCAGTVVMPGHTGSTSPPAGCVSPDTAGAKSAPTTTTPSSSSTPAPATSSTTTSTTTLPSPSSIPPSPPVTGAAVLLQGNGIGDVTFGESQASAISGLDDVLGSVPVGSTSERGNCTIDFAEQWPNVWVYFFEGRFVGYSTLGDNGVVLPDGNLVTPQGLRVGDTLAEAQQIYGSALTTSYAQGGSWRVTTPEGTLEGYLSEELNQTVRGPSTILSIAAGAVGCPAATP